MQFCYYSFHLYREFWPTIYTLEPIKILLVYSHLYGSSTKGVSMKRITVGDEVSSVLVVSFNLSTLEFKSGFTRRLRPLDDQLDYFKYTCPEYGIFRPLEIS